MPTIHIIHSVKIDIYAREHPPPHFHALYAEHEMLIAIDSLQTYAGSLPARQHRLVIAWASQVEIRQFLLRTFNTLNPNLAR